METSVGGLIEDFLNKKVFEIRRQIVPDFEWGLLSWRPPEGSAQSYLWYVPLWGDTLFEEDKEFFQYLLIDDIEFQLSFEKSIKLGVRLNNSDLQGLEAIKNKIGEV